MNTLLRSKINLSLIHTTSVSMILLVALFGSFSVMAADPEPSTSVNEPNNQATDLTTVLPPSADSVIQLPQPLTLQSILDLPHTVSPQVLMSQAKQQAALAQYQQQKASNSIELDIVGRLGWREYADKTEDNHLLALHVGKELYDFGKTSAAQESRLNLSDAQTQLYQDQVMQFQLRLMQGFFNVILADYQYRVDNEDMATVYVTMDKAKDKHELGQISDVEYSRLQSDYQTILVKRTHSEYEQRKTRAMLANLVGQPQNLPDKLQFPSLKGVSKRTLQSLEAYQDEALANNVQLKSLKLKLKAANYQFESESATDKPSFRVDAWGGKLSTYEYQREGRWRFDLSMDYPLYDGGVISSKIGEARANVMQMQAQVRAMEQALRDEVADVFFKLQLVKAEKARDTVYGNYTDLYLDYSRGLYENESKTDLGDAMVRLSESSLQTISTSFQQALNWAKLDYLTGQSIQIATYQ